MYTYNASEYSWVTLQMSQSWPYCLKVSQTLNEEERIFMFKHSNLGINPKMWKHFMFLPKPIRLIMHLCDRMQVVITSRRQFCHVIEHGSEGHTTNGLEVSPICGQSEVSMFIWSVIALRTRVLFQCTRTTPATILTILYSIGMEGFKGFTSTWTLSTC